MSRPKRKKRGSTSKKPSRKQSKSKPKTSSNHKAKPKPKPKAKRRRSGKVGITEFCQLWGALNTTVVAYDHWQQLGAGAHDMFDMVRHMLN